MAEFNKILSPNLHGLAYCFYRLPDEKEIHLCAGNMSALDVNAYKGDGFVISPFVPGSQAFCISPTQWGIVQDTYFNSPQPRLPLYSKPDNAGIDSRQHYCDIVNSATESIMDADMSKVVLSHYEDIPHNKEASFTLPYFYKLTQTYPSAFVYFLSTPPTGTWIGCSPEVLLRAIGDEFFTMALAGTKKIPQMAGANDKDLFTQKEIDEQAWVTDYMMEKLSPYSSELLASSPELKNAGNLYHLVTHFSGKLKEDKNYRELVNILHPTPAICGTPTDKALSFILDNEGYDRELYSGFLGPFTQNKVDIFVNLRCMQVMENNFLRVYAGAGIVKDSVPEDEWEETKNKMNTLLSVFYSL